MLEETRKYMNHLGEYDVIVIGAGHAGIEAAHAAAVLGAKTAVFTMSLDAIGNMPCNPSIGGTAKGTLVRELDALGGVMGLAADATYLQSRMLNKGKGPAVHALRVQTDRKRYHEYMKHALELTPGLAIHQAEIISIEVEDGHVKGVVTQLNGEYGAKCVVIATGTNLGGKIFVGDAWYASGPDGMVAGQVLDTLHHPSAQDELTEVHHLKTGAMIAGACMLGVGAAGGSEAARKAAETYGYQLGLAFQIRDDMLDVIGNADEFGKPIGSDKDEGKVTYVDLLGLDDCGKLIHELTEQAVSAVSDLDREGFLTALAESLTERTK